MGNISEKLNMEHQVATGELSEQHKEELEKMKANIDSQLEDFDKMKLESEKKWEEKKQFFEKETERLKTDLQTSKDDYTKVVESLKQGSDEQMTEILNRHENELESLQKAME